MDLSAPPDAPVVRPRTREELCEALRSATREALVILPRGGGVSLAGDIAHPRYDLAIDLTGLDRVIEYEPEDLTLTAECGVTLETLRARLTARGQELPLEAPDPSRATLGGVLAANASGARRLRFGAPRDRILGARFALADGTLARTGGKVVKNVAGYGIHRLLCGSRGGLAIIVEASLKLMPAPARRVALIHRATRAEIAEAGRWSSLPRLEPAVLTVVGGELALTALGPIRVALPADEMMVVLGLEDDAAWVERQASLVAEALGAPAARVEGDDALALWQRLVDLEERDGARLSFATSSNTPAALAPLLAGAEMTRSVFHALAGRLHLLAPIGESRDVVERCAAHGFTLIGGRGAPDLAPAIPTMEATLRLRSRIREALDPERRMAFGDRWERGGY